MTVTAAILAFLLPASPAAAAPGAEAMPFLKLDAGPRPASLGGAYCAAGEGPVSVFYNPALAGGVSRPEIYLAHNEWLEDLRIESAAYVHPAGYRLTFFGTVNALLSDAMEKYDASGGSLGDFDSSEYALGAGLAYYLGAGFHFGAAAKLLRQSVDGEGAAGWAGDAGLAKKWKRWSAGLSVSNLGGELELGSEAFEVPAIIRAGAAFRPVERVLVAGEVIGNGDAGTEGALGAELGIPSGSGQDLFIRTGFRSGRDDNTGPGFSAGLGLHTGPLWLDYSFSPYGDLGGSHRLSLSFAFGSPRPETDEKPYAPVRNGNPYWRERKTSAPPASRPAASPAPKKEQKEEIFLLW